MRSARGFNKQVELWQTATTRTSSGGSKVASYLIATTWANVKSLKGLKAVTDLGLDYTVDNLVFTLRLRSDIDMNSKTLFMKYRGVAYTITSYPQNKDFVGAYVSFIGVASKQSSYPVYGPLDATGIYNVYEQRVTGQGGSVESPSCTLNHIDGVFKG